MSGGVIKVRPNCFTDSPENGTSGDSGTLGCGAVIESHSTQGHIVDFIDQAYVETEQARMQVELFGHTYPDSITWPLGSSFLWDERS